MSSEAPLPPNPEEAISAEPLGPAFPEPPPPTYRRGRPLLAWLVIVIIVGLILTAGSIRPSRAKTAVQQHKQQLRLEDVQIRYLVGANEFLKALGQPRQDLYAQARSALKGPIDQRLRLVVIGGELQGPEEALQQLDQLQNEKGSELTTEQQRSWRLLHQLYTKYARSDFAPLPEDDSDFLRQELGWTGALALHPASGPDSEGRAAVLAQAFKTFVAILLVFGGLLMAGLAGFAVLMLLVTLALKGKVRSGMAEPSGTGGLYAETFALWLVLFLTLSVGAELLPTKSFRFVLLGAAMLTSLLGALAWPMIWGVPWRQIRQELGLYFGPRPLLEVLLGPVTYISAIPLLAIGLILTLLLMKLQSYLVGSDGGVPSHPIVEALERPTVLEFVQILFLASVAAPIVEETMFRGVLYRHLREASARVRTLVSVLWSAAVVSFIFAVIHPQGLVAVPALMALAVAFCLAREWRGSLVPAIVAHGLNNALVLTFATFLFSS
jgi:membrane protease YdiL (CAAX protease family)